MPHAAAISVPCSSATPRVATGRRRAAWIGAVCACTFALTACDETTSQAAPQPAAAQDLGPSVNVNAPEYRGYTRGFLVGVQGRKIQAIKVAQSADAAFRWSDEQVKQAFAPLCKSTNPDQKPVSVTNVAHSPNRTILTFIQCG